ncbi:FtsX-like permease family protein [Desulfoferrobacter suflitae]|uniref:FtsX-like permease family protein n=1 Tax=Desulfoferrobacter suflitae TaxID=2865782 RepID=UPI0021644701|nr:FtsX-like permease family protein [Desulfoferrobacter suflitae]MCK8601102.1 FtsX-like permease family protein [Desulfoferrobacter suflitae]
MRSLTLFLRLWTWFSYRQLYAHRWRALAVLLGIGLGAAVFTSVRLAVNASLHSFTQSMDTISGRADWSVVKPGGRVPETLISDLLKNPSVKTASPLLKTYVQAGEQAAREFLLIGLDPILDRALRPWQMDADALSASTWLDLIGQPGTLLLTHKLMASLRLESGGDIKLKYFGRSSKFRILGVLNSQGLALADAGYVAITDIASMQEFTGLHGVVDRIDILLKSTATVRDIERIRAALPAGVILSRPSEAREAGRMMIDAYRLNLSVLSFVSLFVGMFLVYSLVSLNATSRRHELAILRSLGASSKELFWLFITEGAFLGIVGWLLAIPISSFMVHKLLHSVSATITHLFVRVNVDRLKLDPWEVLLSFCVTLLISVLAAYQPAREAVRVPPKEAFLMHDRSLPGHKPLIFPAFVGLFLITIVLPLPKLAGVSHVPFSGYVATFFLFAGFSLLSPWFLAFMGTFLPPLLRYVGGQPAYLGSRYMRDAGSRIAISVGALITAMALYVALVIMVHSFRNTVETWVNQSIRGDVFLQTQTGSVNEYRDPLPGKVVEQLESMQDRIDLLPYRRVYLYEGNIRYLFEAIDFSIFSKYGRLLFLEGDSPAIMQQLAKGEGVIVSEVMANQLNLKIGEYFHAKVGGADFNMPILGIYRDYRTQGGVLHYSLKHYQKLTGDLTWTGTRVFLRNDQPPPRPSREAIMQQLYRIVRHTPGVVVTIGSDLRREILRIFDETFAITTVLLLIALFVAALGITTTLTVLVLERTRELNTLLAIGASFRQIRAMIFWEAVLMVTAGQILGAGCGFILSRLLIYVINRQSFGWTFLYSVDWGSLSASLPLIFTTALLAAIPASRMAFRQSPASLLRER